MSLKIVQFPVGPLEMNATLVMDEDSRETIFFDPGDEISKILDYADEQEMNITRLIATHCHIDHRILLHWSLQTALRDYPRRMKRRLLQCDPDWLQ